MVSSKLRATIHRIMVTTSTFHLRLISYSDIFCTNHCHSILYPFFHSLSHRNYRSFSNLVIRKESQHQLTALKNILHMAQYNYEVCPQTYQAHADSKVFLSLLH